MAQGNISSAKSSLQLLEALKSNIFQMLADPDALIYEGSDIGSQTTKDMFRPSEASAGAGETTTRLAEPFSWSIEAYGIRDEIADLADVEKDVIKEHTSIFELGLDSIDAIKLSSRLKRRGIDLPVSMLMKLPTVAGMTEHSSTTFTSFKQEGNRVSLADFRGSVQDLLQQREEDIDDIEHILPVTPLQEAMVAEMVQSEYVRYFNHDLLKLMPSVDINRLEYAWKTVVEHSPILRTSFAEIDDPEIVSTYAQIIHRQSNIGWTNKYIKGLEKVQKVFDSVRQEAARNTERSPPCKLTVVKCGKDTYLIVSIAHALYDGWSLGLLHEDVRRAYAGRYIARPFYSDMVADIVGASGPAAATYWKHAISGAKGQSFPQRDLSKHPLTRVVNRIERISSTPVEEIQSFCRAQGITIQTLGHTCWACMLAYYLKALEVVFGSVLSGRNTEEANEIVFPCMNTVAIRSILHGTRKEMLRYMQEIGVSLILYQHFPLRKVQAMTETPSQKLFDTLFIYQKRPQQQSSEETMLYESIESSSEVDVRIPPTVLFCTSLTFIVSYLRGNGASQRLLRMENGLLRLSIEQRPDSGNARQVRLHFIRHC